MGLQQCMVHVSWVQPLSSCSGCCAPNQVDKARSWLNRAVLLEPDCGDFWALLAKFEAQHGTPETQAAVVERLKAAEPHHGERWQRVAKDPANAHLPIDAVLKKVVLDIDKEPPP